MRKVLRPYKDGSRTPTEISEALEKVMDEEKYMESITFVPELGAWPCDLCSKHDPKGYYVIGTEWKGCCSNLNKDSLIKICSQCITKMYIVLNEGSRRYEKVLDKERSDDARKKAEISKGNE